MFNDIFALSAFVYADSEKTRNFFLVWSDFLYDVSNWRDCGICLCLQVHSSVFFWYVFDFIFDRLFGVGWLYCCCILSDFDCPENGKRKCTVTTAIRNAAGSILWFATAVSKFDANDSRCKTACASVGISDSVRPSRRGTAIQRIPVSKAEWITAIDSVWQSAALCDSESCFFENRTAAYRFENGLTGRRTAVDVSWCRLDYNCIQSFG